MRIHDEVFILFLKFKEKIKKILDFFFFRKMLLFSHKNSYSSHYFRGIAIPGNDAQLNNEIAILFLCIKRDLNFQIRFICPWWQLRSQVSRPFYSKVLLSSPLCFVCLHPTVKDLQSQTDWIVGLDMSLYLWWSLIVEVIIMIFK